MNAIDIDCDPINIGPLECGAKKTYPENPFCIIMVYDE